MSLTSIIVSPYTWIIVSFIFLIALVLCLLFLFYLSKKTHAIMEIKGILSGKPIALFFRDDKHCEWKCVSPDAGIITDKSYGCFIINEAAVYVDKKTKGILIPFDSNFGASVNIKAAKLADDLHYISKDSEQLKALRFAIANNLLEENKSIDVLKTSVNIGAIKSMMTALIPHNINAKIEKVIAARLKSYGGNTNVTQVALLFGAMLGAILLGALVIKLAFPH